MTFRGISAPLNWFGGLNGRCHIHRPAKTFIWKVTCQKRNTLVLLIQKERSYTKEVILSKAFISLSKNGKTILLMLLLKRQMPGNNKIMKHIPKDTILNNGEIELSYPEINSLGMHNSQLTDGLKDCVKKGFVEVAKEGGKCKGDYNWYRLIDDWKDYGKPTFKERSKDKTIGYGFCSKDYHNERREKIKIALESSVLN